MARKWPRGASRLCRERFAKKRQGAYSGLASEQHAAIRQSLVLSGFLQCFWSSTQQNGLESDSDSNRRAHSERSEIVSDIYRYKSIADLERLFRRIRDDRRVL